MGSGPDRRTIVRIGPEFDASYQRYRLIDPRIRDQLTIFNKKRAIPPLPLPPHFKDHALKGALQGLRECHLAHDILLLYTHKADVLRLVLVCDHVELGREKAKTAARSARNSK